MEAWLTRYRCPLNERDSDAQNQYAIIYDNGYTCAAYMRNEKVGEFPEKASALKALHQLENKIPGNFSNSLWTDQVVIEGIVRSAK